MLRIALELPSNEAVRAAVEAGLGATAISASVAAPSLESGLLHQLRLALPERDFNVLRHVERYRSSAADALLAMIIAQARPRARLGSRRSIGQDDRSEPPVLLVGRPTGITFAFDIIVSLRTKGSMA